MEDLPTPKKTLWQQVMDTVTSPMAALSHITKESPLIAILAIVFVFQPVISTGIDLVKELVEVRQTLDPSKRPVSKSELDIVNAKIDFIQSLIVTDMQNDAKAAEERREHWHASQPMAVDKTPEKVVPYVELQKKLSAVQSKLDKDYKAQPKK